MASFTRLGAAVALLLLAVLALQGCERGCVRDVSMAVKSAANDYLEPAWQFRARQRGARQNPYAPALVKLRGLVGTGMPVDWRLMSMAERQLALVGLMGMGMELDDREMAMLDLLLADDRVDPFAPDPFGVPPFAVAMLESPRVARRLVALLDDFPASRPPDAVLCGLRGRGLPGTLGPLRAYCACVKED
jgi:hypothetical protein